MMTPGAVDNSILMRSVKESFESLVFSFVEVLPPSSSHQFPETTLWATMQVQEPVEGYFTLAMPADLTKELAGNLFGEENLDPEKINDILKELLNTLAGKFISESLPQAQLKFSVPHMGTGPFEQSDLSSIEWLFSVSGAIVSLSVQGEGLVKICQD